MQLRITGNFKTRFWVSQYGGNYFIIRAVVSIRSCRFLQTLTDHHIRHDGHAHSDSLILLGIMSSVNTQFESLPSCCLLVFVSEVNLNATN